ncbi:hypothetical protein OG21DRAFT_1525719 [Imleria badia]|nr:hypothetical protein OG21DRAFT_1525719 [Imleria badia]
MSKRKGDVAVLKFMKRGWEPEALINWLALAGWGQVLEPAKLEYLNKHRLMRSWKDDQGTLDHARSIQSLVRVAFPSSQQTNSEYIAKVIHALQGRVTVLKDVPSLAPYFFLEPDYSTAEAQVMRESMSKDDYREHWPFSIASLELN